MRILMLAQFFPPDIGGEERHVFNLANTLARRGHDVAVATQHLADVPDYEVLDSGVRVHRFTTAAMHLPGVYSTGRAHHLPLPDPLGVRELARIAALERPDVVHAHNWIVNSAVALRRSAAGPRFGLVLTLHDYSHVCATKRLMRDGAICPGPSATRCLPCATKHYGPAVGPVTVAATALMRPWKDRAVDHLVCVSRAVADGNHVAQRPDCSVIPNFIPDEAVLRDPLVPGSAGAAGSEAAGSEADSAGADSASAGSAAAEGTDADVPPELPSGDFMLFAGDLTAEKGVVSLLRAYESLGSGRPPLLLVGRRTPDTPERLPDGAQICGPWPHQQVLTAFRRATLAVLPSVWPDPCPTTVLEAMASGSPVVSTAIGGILDMVVDEESGLLVTPGDSDQLARAMGRLVGDAELRARLAAGGQQRVRQFTASVVAERLEAVYAQVAKSATASSKAAKRNPRRQEANI
jgi:glycosyltransferase involved in cell wall biosynthesis